MNYSKHITDLNAIVQLIGQGTAVVLYVISGFFFIRLMLALFSSQIDISGGKPGAAADMIQETMYILLSLIFALDAPRLAEGFASLALANQNVLSAKDSTILDIILLYEPVFQLLFNIVGTLVFSTFMINMVLSGFTAQYATLVGSTDGISKGVMNMVSIVATLIVGLTMLRIGGSAIAYFTSIVAGQ